MKRTTVMMPATLKTKAARRARREGISLGDLIRKSVEEHLSMFPAKRLDPCKDPFFSDTFLFDGGPTDVAANHDKYLDQMMDEELERNGHNRKSTRSRGRR